MDTSYLLYIDPGSSSAILATVIGAVAGLSMYIKTKWQSIRYRSEAKK